MKTKTILSGLLGMMVFLAGFLTENAYAQPGGAISMQTFYDELSPYGEWIDDEEYGYVWRPDVDEDFRPYYTNGRWMMTNYGNTWVSDYDWGWAPFHYGRWHNKRHYGWVWVPDVVWGPAWVSWRSGNGYYGWAPMGPRVSINISFGPRYYVPDPYWVFIPQNNIYSRFPRYYSYGRNKVIIRNTTIINNTYVYNRNTYVCGPRANDVRRHTGRDVRVYTVSDNNRPGRPGISNNHVNIYRPRITERGDATPQTVSRPRSADQGEISARPRNNGQVSDDYPANASSRPRSTAPSRGRSPEVATERQGNGNTGVRTRGVTSPAERPVIKEDRPQNNTPQSRPRPSGRSSQPEPQRTERRGSSGEERQRIEKKSSRPEGNSSSGRPASQGRSGGRPRP